MNLRNAASWDKPLRLAALRRGLSAKESDFYTGLRKKASLFLEKTGRFRNERFARRAPIPDGARTGGKKTINRTSLDKGK